MKLSMIIILGAAIVLLLALFFCVIFFRRMNRRMTAYQNDLAEKHYEEVESMYRQMRGWRHDYKHHIQTMKAHLALKQIGRASCRERVSSPV